jgi:hypothetical protein
MIWRSGYRFRRETVYARSRRARCGWELLMVVGRQPKPRLAVSRGFRPQPSPSRPLHSTQGTPPLPAQHGTPLRSHPHLLLFFAIRLRLDDPPRLHLLPPPLDHQTFLPRPKLDSLPPNGPWLWRDLRHRQRGETHHGRLGVAKGSYIVLPNAFAQNR